MELSALSGALQAQVQMGKLVSDVLGKSTAQAQQTAALAMQQKVQANANIAVANGIGANLDVLA